MNMTFNDIGPQTNEVNAPFTAFNPGKQSGSLVNGPEAAK
jgi:hypothetical protein